MKPIVELLSKNGTKEKRLHNAEVLNFSLAFGGGKAQVFIPKNTIDSGILTKKKRIAISLWNRKTNEYQRAYTGFIDGENQTGDGYKLGLEPIHSLFKKRFTNVSQNFSGDAGEKAQALLAQTNADDETGVSAGTEDVSATINIDANETAIFSTWGSMADEAGAEWDITPDHEFNFLQRLGTDKSESVIIRHKFTEANRSILEDFDFEAEGSTIANRIIAENANGDRYTAEDTDSIAKYGLWVEKVRIDAAPNATTLQTLAEALLAQKKEEFFDVVVAPIPYRTTKTPTGKERGFGLGFFDVSLGDDVRVILDDGNRSVDETRRILEIKFKVEQNGSEKVELTLSRTGAKTTALQATSDANERESILRRLRTLESLT